MANSFGLLKGIETLPENILLEVFKYLPVKDLCTAGRVCRRWRRVVSDNTLWRHVDLHQYKLNLRKMWKVIRSHFSDVLISLRLRGYMDPTIINWKKQSLSDAMLKELQLRCPNIEELELIQTNVTNISCQWLPHKLRTLKITHSYIPQGWFEQLSQNPCSTQLKDLDLSHSRMTSVIDINHLSCLKTLSCIKINGCYRVNERGIRIIAESFPELTVLEVSSTKCTDLALHHISTKLASLVRLNLSHCHMITDAGLADIGACLKQLEWLHLQGCIKITDQGVMHLVQLDRLCHCDLTETKITEVTLDKLRTSLKECCFVYQQSQTR